MKSLKAKFRKSDAHEWSKNDERLLSAVEHGEADKVLSLLAKKGASAVKLDSEGKSALHLAASRGQVECLAVILAHGADTSVADTSGFSALHLACRNDHQECVRKLIQSKCVLDAVDGSGKTALHHAAANGNVAIVQMLCEQKCPVNLEDLDGCTPLLLSARHAHVEVCQSLVHWGADINARDKSGRTAVILASESSSLPTVDTLIQLGADLRLLDSLGHDVLHYAKLSGSGEVLAVLSAALQRLRADSEGMSPKEPQHDQVTRLSEDRSSTPKKRKAPPPPVSPIQLAEMASPPYLTPTETPLSGRSDVSKKQNYKEEELKNMMLREEVEKLREENHMLLEVIEDLRQIVEQTGPKAGHCENEESSLVAALQVKIASLTLENQQLAHILKKRVSPPGEAGMRGSRPSSLDSNASYHSTRAEFDQSAEVLSPTLEEEGDPSHVSALDFSALSSELNEKEEENNAKGGGEEEIRLLREALRNLQLKLQESRLENQTLQARLTPCPEEGVEEESETELRAQIGDLRGKLQEAKQDLVALRAGAVPVPAERGNDGGETSLEEEVRELKAQLASSVDERQRDASLIRGLKAQLEARCGQMSADECRELKSSCSQLVENANKEKALLVDRYKEAQEEIRLLQEALRGTVPVEAAAKDFDEMKAELNQAIDGLQRRLLELSHSYSDAKSELAVARSLLDARRTEDPRGGSDAARLAQEQHERQVRDLVRRLEEAQGVASETEAKYATALQEFARLQREAEAQTRSSVALADHTQVVSSMGSAIKDLEVQLEALKVQLSQRDLQVEALQNRMTAVENVEPDDVVSRLEHEQLRESLEKEVGHLTLLLQDALRKQDEMALEAAAAWQEVKDGRDERLVLQGLATSRDQEKSALSAKYREAQEAIVELKKQAENLLSSEKDKNKKIEDLTREASKLKEALNSLSQLSYTTAAPKRQNLQVDTLQHQLKQLQYQLAESKKQHHEIVSVYRMHLLYAVQGQMDEDVQKALKQILMMCKMPTEAK